MRTYFVGFGAHSSPYDDHVLNGFIAKFEL